MIYPTKTSMQLPEIYFEDDRSSFDISHYDNSYHEGHGLFPVPQVTEKWWVSCQKSNFLDSYRNSNTLGWHQDCSRDRNDQMMCLIGSNVVGTLWRKDQASHKHEKPEEYFEMEVGWLHLMSPHVWHRTPLSTNYPSKRGQVRSFYRLVVEGTRQEIAEFVRLCRKAATLSTVTKHQPPVDVLERVESG